jgi:hypothetical protein
MRQFCLGVLLAGLAVFSSFALGHEMSMAEMQIRELTQGEFLWQWGATEKRAASEDLTPLWPSGCQAEANMLLCGTAGLIGELSLKAWGRVIRPHW